MVVVIPRTQTSNHSNRLKLKRTALTGSEFLTGGEAQAVEGTWAKETHVQKGL